MAVLPSMVGPCLICFKAIAMLFCSRYWATAALNGSGSAVGESDLPQP